MRAALRRYVAPLSLALLVGGLSAASAATLSGLRSGTMGADAGAVAACDQDGVSVAYTTSYDVVAQSFVVSGATISGIAPACLNQTLTATVHSPTGVSLSTASTIVAGTTASVSITATPVSSIGGTAVVITG